MIAFEELAIQQGEFKLSNLSLSVEKGAYAMLLGPTGCGKTTILEAICGLRRIASGSIKIDSIDVTNVPPAQRDIGYVPQDTALFPTMTVDKQIQFGLLVRNVNSSERKQRVQQLAELTGVSHLLKRLPLGLSGGEQQRIAIARALSFRPKLLCLDEPLSALDDCARSRLSDLLATIHQQECTTVLHVTHNTEDAARLGTVYFQFSENQIERSERSSD